MSIRPCLVWEGEKLQKRQIVDLGAKNGEEGDVPFLMVFEIKGKNEGKTHWGRKYFIYKYRYNLCLVSFNNEE